MTIGSLFLLGLFVFPLWNIMLEAPQYPDPIGMNIHITGIKDVKHGDIQNIDLMNHYIGMMPIPKNDEMKEFELFPAIVIVMVALGVIIGILGFFRKVNHWWFIGWFILMSILGLIGMYDFNNWLTFYGSNLDPHAIMAYTDENGVPMTYKPPLIGNQKMLNFYVMSWPSTGAWLMFVGMMSTVAAFFIGKKEYQKSKV